MAGATIGIVAAVVLGLALLLILVVVGSLLPRDHVVTRRLTVSGPPGEVWAAISDLGGQLTWRSSLQGTSKISDPAACQGDVGEIWREVSGRHALDLKTLECTPPTSGAPGRLVRELVNPRLPFRGRWEYEVAAAPDGPGTVVAVTERGTVHNPLFRALNRLFGLARTIETYLRDLARRLGEPVRVR